MNIGYRGGVGRRDHGAEGLIKVKDLGENRRETHHFAFPLKNKKK